MAEEPRVNLEATDGTVLGILWKDSTTGEVVLEDTDSGNQVRLGTDGLAFGEGTTLVHDRDDVAANAVTDGSGYYSVDTSGGAVTLTLASADAVEGREVNVKRDGGDNVTITTEGSETIEGDSSIDLTNDGETVTLVYNDGATDWEVW